MNISISNRIAKQFSDTLQDLEPFKDINGSDVDINLASLTRSEVVKIHAALATSKVYGAKFLAANIKKYLKAADDGISTVTASTVRQAAWMLEMFISKLDHYAVFCADDYEGGSYVGYYVCDVRYVPENRYGGGHYPEHVAIRLAYISNDTRHTTDYEFMASDVQGLTAEGILRKSKLYPETPMLWARLKDETERFYAVREKVGKKYLGKGIGVLDIDNAASTKTTYYVGNRRNAVRLDNFGMPSPLVVDVLSESDSANRDRDNDAQVNLYRWHKQNLRFFSPSEDEVVRHLEANEETDFAPELQIPVHPLVPCFDLKRHVRLRCHINNMEEYTYRSEVASGLIIPQRDRELVEVLVDHSSNTFKDVVEGKGQSMNVLAGGPPGTGKTLTAEVFAEFKQRPLYNVQCSQLGLKPDEIESRLSVVLQRANRWNAVLLLDEADVYIRRRGTELQQNAIVGVFLRMLEYANCILFMTTNLANDVDDAIASRCIVRIDYHLPSKSDQVQIWRRLADLNDIALPDREIAKFVEAYPRISGRDVKNLLKLASITAKGKTLTCHDLVAALNYKPTANIKED